MNKEILLNIIKDDCLRKYQNKQDRIKHIKGVVEEATKLAKHYNLDVTDIQICAWIHDYTKYDTINDQISYLTNYEVNKYKDTIVMYHALSAAKYLQDVYNIKEKHIVEAVKYHVYGKPKIDKFSLILLLADKIEPSRNYPQVETLRKLAYSSLELAYKYFITEHVKYLQSLDVKLNKDLEKIYIEIQKGFKVEEN